MLDVINCIIAVLTVYCVWLALADHTAPASGKYTRRLCVSVGLLHGGLLGGMVGSLSSTSVQLCRVITCCVRLVPGGVGFCWL